MNAAHSTLQSPLIAGDSADPGTGVNLTQTVGDNQTQETNCPSTELLIDMDLAISSEVIGEMLDSEVREELDRRRLEELTRIGKLATHD